MLQTPHKKLQQIEINDSASKQPRSRGRPACYTVSCNTLQVTFSLPYYTVAIILNFICKIKFLIANRPFHYHMQ